jgi:hypothetical protein
VRRETLHVPVRISHETRFASQSRFDLGTHPVLLCLTPRRNRQMPDHMIECRSFCVVAVAVALVACKADAPVVLAGALCLFCIGGGFVG